MIQLSAKTQNACLASLELAKRFDSPQPVCLRTIAEEQNISSQFLVQILLQLKRGGLVASTRGAGGGYRLALPPSQISLLDIVTAMEGTPSPLSLQGDEHNEIARVFCESWSSLAEQHRQRLAAVSLETLVAATETNVADMYYI